MVVYAAPISVNNADTVPFGAKTLGHPVKLTSARSFLVFLAIGLLVAAISIKTIGMTAAISAPTDLSEWFQANAMPELGTLLWDAVIVFGLGIGLLSFASLLATYRLMLPATLGSVVAFFVGVLAMAYLVVPLASAVPSTLFIARPWYSFGFELAVLISAFAAYLISTRMNRKQLLLR